jgi:hypothetical protein
MRNWEVEFGSRYRFGIRVIHHFTIRMNFSIYTSLLVIQTSQFHDARTRHTPRTYIQKKKRTNGELKAVQLSDNPSFFFLEKCREGIVERNGSLIWFRNDRQARKKKEKKTS